MRQVLLVVGFVLLWPMLALADQEVEASFEDEAPASTAPKAARLPQAQESRWLVLLPLSVVGLLAWNVRWRERRRAPRGDHEA